LVGTMAWRPCSRLLWLLWLLAPVVVWDSRTHSNHCCVAQAEDPGQGADDMYFDDEDDDYVIDEEEEERARAQSLHDKALALAIDGKEGEALPLFAQAAELQPGNVGFMSDLGVTQMRVGLLDQALATFTQADELSPGMRLIQDNLKALQEHLDYRQEQLSKQNSDRTDL